MQKAKEYNSKMVKFYSDIKSIIGTEGLSYNEVLEIFKIGYEIYKNKKPFIDKIVDEIAESKTIESKKNEKNNTEEKKQPEANSIKS